MNDKEAKEIIIETRKRLNDLEYRISTSINRDRKILEDSYRLWWRVNLYIVIGALLLILISHFHTNCKL